MNSASIPPLPPSHCNHDDQALEPGAGTAWIGKDTHRKSLTIRILGKSFTTILSMGTAAGATVYDLALLPRHRGLVVGLIMEGRYKAAGILIPRSLKTALQLVKGRIMLRFHDMRKNQPSRSGHRMPFLYSANRPLPDQISSHNTHHLPYDDINVKSFPRLVRRVVPIHFPGKRHRWAGWDEPGYAPSSMIHHRPRRSTWNRPNSFSLILDRESFTLSLFFAEIFQLTLSQSAKRLIHPRVFLNSTVRLVGL